MNRSHLSLATGAVLFAVVGIATVLQVERRENEVAATPAPETTVYRDAPHDGQSGIEIRRVEISDDPRSDFIALTVTADLPPDDKDLYPTIQVKIDADLNSASGEAGTDYKLIYQLFPDNNGGGSDRRWLPGRGWAKWPELSTQFTSEVTNEGASHKLVWQFRRANLGGTRAFAFVVSSSTLYDQVPDRDEAVSAGDRAPQFGRWVYHLAR